MTNWKTTPPPTPHNWASAKKPSMKRRCEQHDYRDRGIYMVTLATEGRRPLLGTLRGNPDITEGEAAPRVVLSPLGERVKACWEEIPRHHPVVEPLKLCIMPDHIHGILFVHSRMEKHLGHVVEGFKTGTRKAARELGLLPAAPAFSTPAPAALLAQPTRQQNTTPPTASTAASSAPVRYAALPAQPSPSRHTAAGRAHGVFWETGYHDRILLGKNQLQRMSNYLDDNPRRLLLKRLHSEFFTHLGALTVADIPMEAIGNRFLLDNPVKLQVQCSRSLTPPEIEQRKATFLQAGRDGAILVSPCISPGEQQIATAAMQAHIPLIVLLLNGFPPHFKPKPRYLEACASGRLLMLAPFPYQNQKLEHLRQRCLQLNHLAATISRQ